MTEPYEMVESTPEIDELLQQDPPAMSTVPVDVQGPVTTYKLPNRRVRTDEVTVPNSGWTKLVDATRKRAHVTFISMDEPIRVRTSSSGEGTPWPDLVPLTMYHTQDVWMKSATTDTPTNVGVIEEYWAD